MFLIGINVTPGIAEDNLSAGVPFMIVQLSELLDKLCVISLLIFFREFIEPVLVWDVTPE